VEWSRPAEPAVEEVAGPDGIDVVAGDGALEFGSGVRDLDLVGPFQVAVADGDLGELQLPSVSCGRLLLRLPLRQILLPVACIQVFG
jgi:hypothetical protein